jgi:hypothetical protein
MRRTSDGLLAALALAHGAALGLGLPAPLIALGFWWNANTISHNFIHRPFFRSRSTHRLFCGFLTLVLGVPQSLWAQSHLAHHADRPWRLKLSRWVVVEILLVVALWVALAALAPAYLLAAYLPGLALGLGLCHLQGVFEHRGAAVSHYGRLYNFFFFNDGYHAEHHARPRLHWAELPSSREPGAPQSRWPPVFRWLDLLEQAVLSSAPLQRFMIETHRRAFERLLKRRPAPKSVAVVGGALFPRSVLALRTVFPEARLTVIDASAKSVDSARPLLPDGIEVRREWFDAGRHHGFDLIVVPLAYRGDRLELYRRPPAPAVIVHDWIWRRRGRGTVVSVPLLKRMNLVTA